jgi:hypothetical protein
MGILTRNNDANIMRQDTKRFSKEENTNAR